MQVATPNVYNMRISIVFDIEKRRLNYVGCMILKWKHSRGETNSIKIFIQFNYSCTDVQWL